MKAVSTSAVAKPLQIDNVETATLESTLRQTVIEAPTRKLRGSKLKAITIQLPKPPRKGQFKKAREVVVRCLPKPTKATTLTPPPVANQNNEMQALDNSDAFTDTKNILQSTHVGSRVLLDVNPINSKKQKPNTMHRKDNFACDFCEKTFRKNSLLIEHRRLHTGEKPFLCEKCNKCFRKKGQLVEHLMRHSKKKNFKCNICNLAVSTNRDLSLHMRHHNNDRRHQCELCPKAFVRSGDLKTHSRVHTNEKPYACVICKKTFRANQNLIGHKRMHAGDRKYKCDFCDKRFVRNIDRQTHHRSHTGEKPCKCEICGRGYSAPVHLRAHLQRVHAECNESNTKSKQKGKAIKNGKTNNRLDASVKKNKSLIKNAN